MSFSTDLWLKLALTSGVQAKSIVDVLAVWVPFVELAPGYNHGGVFNLMEDDGVIFLLISPLSVIGLMILYGTGRTTGMLYSWLFGLIVGGMTANFVDRMINDAVLTYIRIPLHSDLLPYWPAFNLADLWVLIGSGGLLLHYWLTYDRPPPASPMRTSVPANRTT